MSCVIWNKLLLEATRVLRRTWNKKQHKFVSEVATHGVHCQLCDWQEKWRGHVYSLFLTMVLMWTSVTLTRKWRAHVYWLLLLLESDGDISSSTVTHRKWLVHIWLLLESDVDTRDSYQKSDLHICYWPKFLLECVGGIFSSTVTTTRKRRRQICFQGSDTHNSLRKWRIWF